MSEIWFYHLTDTPLEVALPPMLSMSIDRGWAVRIRADNPERLDYLDRHFWTYSNESFLPHGRAGGAHDAEQPVLLSSEAANANNAQCVMFVDGAIEPFETLSGYDRVCVLFDGNDPEATQTAREQWKSVQDAGLTGKYYAQENGRWVNKA